LGGAGPAAGPPPGRAEGRRGVVGLSDLRDVLAGDCPRRASQDIYDLCQVLGERAASVERWRK
jgi:hypothetical protein